jgi:pimeloyl-ACP methyl ester carboxylesterase
MQSSSTNIRRLALAVVAAALACAALAPPAMSKVPVTFKRIAGFPSKGTPAKYNKVGILKVGSRKARNVLVLNPGTSASASYFAPLAKDVVKRAKNWQVWAVERRENLLEDHSVLNRAKRGKATPEELFNYYLAFITDSTITDHFEFIPDAEVGYAREWGMRTEIEDLNRVVKAAKRLGGKVAVGGHSLGGSITTAYATWDFNGKPGAKGVSGLVFIDGGSSPTPITSDEATERLNTLNSSTPWLSFGGIGAPFAGLFNATGSTAALIAPNEANLAWDWDPLPANLKPPVLPTNLAQYGYALDTETSPPSLAAAQAHLGKLRTSGSPRGWDQAGEITPIKRFAQMFSGWGLRGLDGTAWYHPQRLTLDSGAVAAGNSNPAQTILGVRATHGHDLSKRLRIYAFGAALGGQRVLDAARTLASQSGIPKRNLKLVDRHTTYSHNDPNSASPTNDFVKNLVPFLKKIGRR